jgi:uncharacterized protein
MRRGKTTDIPKVKSPCVQICRLTNDQCVGCYRTSEEISKWLWLTDEERLFVLAELKKRKSP